MTSERFSHSPGIAFTLPRNPHWMEADRYDIVAKSAHDDGLSGQAATAALRPKLRALLASRFHLVVHTDEKEMPIYALVVAKGGPKNLAEPTGETPQFIGRRGIVTCKKTSMKRFAEVALSMRMGRNVVDRTGIDGEYDFVLRYSEEQGAAAASDTSAPDFLTALQEQLGLKLESARGPVEVIVVDHVEKASGN